MTEKNVEKAIKDEKSILRWFLERSNSSKHSLIYKIAIK